MRRRDGGVIEKPRIFRRVWDTHPDVSGVFALRYPHHPQKLVNVVPRVADHTPEDDQNIVHVQRPHDAVGCTLVGRHGFAHLDAGREAAEGRQQLRPVKTPFLGQSGK